MVRKRKLEPKTTEASEPSKKQQQQQQQQKVSEEPKPQKEPEDEAVEEDEEEDEEDVEEDEYEEYEEEEDEEEEDSDDEEEEEGNAANHAKTPSVSGVGGGVGGDDDEEESIQKLLEPFSKDQLLNLLIEASEKHGDVADLIRKVANEDPVNRKIFVHGLGWDTNAEALTAVFKQYGEIEDCKAVCDKVSGKSKGYGFILFKSRGGARRALKQPQKKIGNRMTACQLASVGPVPPSSTAAASGAPAPQSQPTSEYTLRKIYVSNVGAELDPQKLYTFFSKYGEIEEGPLGLDKMTGRPKGFCLFVYKSMESAKRALEEPHKNFEGHILHCQRAIDGPKPGKAQHQHQNQHQHQPHHNHNSHSHGNQFQRNENPGYVAGAATATAPGHLMAPAGPGIGFNQGPAAAQALNPALGQALTALLASQGAGLGLTNLLGSFGSTAAVNPGVPGTTGHGIQSAYGSQANISPGVIGGYGNQGAIPGGYPNQQIGPGGSGRGQHGVGQYGVGPTYMGH
ncbi:UBP1-associated protein 2A [Ziziphus jujuba]|uniref:UBP1-associated protein 2A n=1 Tax=Ziziphus jujuba TaxID=326968 RepID=A0A6P4AY48_ZIZJJ|nr:UBP1-associated protein 2A [Ziziphus jujuba]XP_048334736.2 UBP1-associated protein 2A [Ziziphus jujuba]